MPSRRTVITGLGLASSLGGAVTGAAAARARLTRPRKLESQQLEPDNPIPVAVMGYPVAGMTEGTYLVGRWIRLASAALQDLRDYAQLPGPEDVAWWGRTGLVVAAPDDLDDRYLVPEPVDDLFLMNRFVDKLLALSHAPIAPAARRLSRKGHAGVIHGLEQARRDIEEGALDRVIVLGTDSFVESSSLQWLQTQNLLKTASWPVGLIPGEAAACVLLEAESAASARGARPEAVVASAVTLQADEQQSDSLPGWGRAMASVAESALRGARAPLPFSGDLFCDLNGLESRSFDVGSMLGFLHPGVVAPDAPLQVPALSVGELGAASGGVAVAFAVRSFVRGYARRDLTLITSRSADGHVGAACLGRLEPRSGRSR